MSTLDKKVSIYLKKFLTQQQMSENFLDYLLKQSRDNFKTIYPFQGFFSGGVISPAGNDQFQVSTPLVATDGQGHVLKLDPLLAVVPFQNALGILYHVGLRFIEIPRETEINVRTGEIEYTFIEEALGELAEPNSVVDNGATITLVVDSVTEAAVSNAGRKVLVWLKRAKNRQDAFAELTVVWDGSNNKVTVPNLMGQVAGFVSVDPADYQVALLGPTVKRNTDLSADPEVAYLGTVAGTGAGNPITNAEIDQSAQTILFDAETFQILMDLQKAFLTGGGQVTWNLATETLTWAEDIYLRIPNKSYDYIISAQTVTEMNDGDVLYIIVDDIGGVRPLIQVANGDVPNIPTAEPIAFRDGDNIYFRGASLLLEGSSSTTVGSIGEITQDILDFLGADDASDSDPNYTSTEKITQGSSLVASISKLDETAQKTDDRVSQNSGIKLIKGGIWGPVNFTLVTRDEIQRLTFQDIPDAGSFKLIHNGNTTTALAYNAAAIDVQNALNALPSLSAVTVAGNFATGFVITFAGADGAQNQELLQVTDNSLVTIGSVLLSAITVRTGGPGVNELQKLLFDQIPVSGQFTLDFNGQVTSSLAYNATALDIQNALNALSNLSGVIVTGNYASGFIVEFAGADAEIDQPQMTVDSNTLEYNSPILTITPSTDQTGSAGLTELPFSADAYIHVPGLVKERNRIQQSTQSPILLGNDGEVAYVEINRTSGAPANLVVKTKAIEEIDISNENIIIVARLLAGEVLVGNHSFRLIEGQSKYLDAGLSIENQTLLGITEDQSDPDWSGLGAPERFLDPGDSALDGIANLEIELDKLFGQLRITAHETDADKVRITGADKILRDGSILSQEVQNLILKFEGAVIDFTNKQVFESDGATPLGLDFLTDPSIPANQYKWFGLAIVPSGTTADNRITGQVLVTPADSANAVLANAPLPAVAGNKKSGAVLIFNNAGNLELQQIRQFGVSGGGGGAGDASTIQGRLEDLATESFARYLESNVFSLDGDDKVDLLNTTATFSVADSLFNFTIGQILQSLELLDQEFLDELVSLETITVALVFDKDAIDTAPDIEVSRNGGGEFQTVTMERVGQSDTFIGELTFEEEVALQNLKEYPVANADAALVLNATTTQQRSQEFTTSALNQIAQKLTLYVSKTGTPTGYLFVNFHNDNAGNPGDIQHQSLVDIANLTAGNNTLALLIGKRVLAPNTKYHISFSTNLEYKSTYSAGVHEVAIRVDSSAPTIPDSKVYNGTVWAAVAGNSIVHLVEGQELNLLLKYTASMTASLKAYGVYYGMEAETFQRLQKRASFTFHGTNDKATYNLGFQLPWDADPDFVEFLDIGTGQVWKVPALELQNNKGVFPPDFFDGRDIVQLIASQVEAGSYDGNPELKKLTTENYLGSNDPALDKSVAGFGPKVRAENNVLAMITLDSEYNIVIKEA